MAFIKQPSNLSNAILNFVKHLVSKAVYEDIKALLNPCCIPTLEIASDYTCVSPSYTRFNDVTVTGDYKNKTAILLFTITESDGTVQTSTVVATFDENGLWNGSFTMLDYFNDGIADITVSVLVNGSRVVETSKNVHLTGIPSCD